MRAVRRYHLWIARSYVPTMIETSTDGSATCLSMQTTPRARSIGDMGLQGASSSPFSRGPDRFMQESIFWIIYAALSTSRLGM